jgi:predicted hotdog family 3-hydroxylacyl-ACP dehydratase
VTPEFPPVRELVPHEPPMLWLRRVVTHSADATECEANADDIALLRDAHGRAPGYAALELAAQCVSAHARLAATGAQMGPPRIGFLLGTRRFELRVPHLLPGQRMRVLVTRLWGADVGPVSFDAAIRDAESGALLASGRISCFTPSS